MSKNKPKLEREPESSIQLQGWPGYRTRKDRSGLDPLDANAEEGHMEALFIRHLFTLRLRTHDSFHLLLMVVFGVVPSIVLIGLLLTTFLGDNQAHLRDFLIPIFFLVISAVVTINFTLSLLEMVGWIGSARKGPPGKVGSGVPEVNVKRRGKSYK